MDLPKLSYNNPLLLFCDSQVTLDEFCSAANGITQIGNFFKQKFIIIKNGNLPINPRINGNEFLKKGLLENKLSTQALYPEICRIKDSGYVSVFISSKMLNHYDEITHGAGFANTGVFISTAVKDLKKIRLLGIHEMAHYYGLTNQECGHCESIPCIMNSLGPLEKKGAFCKKCDQELFEKKLFIRSI